MQTQLLEALVRMQRTNLYIPIIEGRNLSRNVKHDASKTLGERTKKERNTPRALQVGYMKHIQNHWVGWATLIGFSFFCSATLIRRDPSIYWQEMLELHRERSSHPSMLISTELFWKPYPSRVKHDNIRGRVDHVTPKVIRPSMLLLDGT
jgi:hypothetical protein